MSCNQCVKINPLPECLSGYGSMSISNISFPDYTGETLRAELTDMATDRVDKTEITAGDPIDLSEFFPLFMHPYSLRFIVPSTGESAQFVITNPDDSTATGCCIDFNISSGDFEGEEFIVSTIFCEA